MRDYKIALLLLLCLICGIILLCSPAWASSVGLAWDPLPNPEWGVRVHVGTDPGDYSYHYDAGVGATTFTVPNLTPGTWYFAVSAYDPNHNESGMSNEVSSTLDLPVLQVVEIPPLDESVKQLQITIKVVQ